MATYECSVCGMSVNATCAKCDEPLAQMMVVKFRSPSAPMVTERLNHLSAAART